MSEQRREPRLSAREVQQTQIDPVAGVWYCNNCGRRIQVITDGEKPKVQPFTCVCGVAMIPGDEHTHTEPDPGAAIDD